MSFDISLLTKSLKAGTGLRQSMHGNQYYVFDIKKIINEYKLNDFRLSKSFNKNSMNQRPLEVMYPIKINEKSNNLFLYGNPIDYKELIGCKYIKKIKKITYYECS